MKALFINADSSKPRCAVFQAGKTYAQAMMLCKELDLEYLEIGEGSPAPDLTGYDAVIFNYQHLTCSIIPPSFFSHCPIAIGFLYEARQDPAASPMHFGDLLAGQVFDILISPDPTLVSTPNIWGMPRVVPRFAPPKPIGHSQGIWVSTFGFPSPWKKLDDVVRMMNDELGSGTFRINFAQASHQEGTPLHERQINTANELREIANPGIKISVTSHYMEDEELVAWLGQSDLNVFLSYPERGIETGGALLASADMAISAQRPLLVSDNIEARHLVLAQDFSLRTAMENVHGIEYLYEQWSPENFAARMDEAIRENLE